MPDAAGQPSEPPDATQHEESGPDAATRKPSKWAWAALVLLVLIAVAIPLAHKGTLLQDDFTTPTVLREWPEDASTYAYVDGEYHVRTYAKKQDRAAYRILPTPVSGMSLAVDARIVEGSPLIAVECATVITERPASDGSAGTTKEVTGSYAFLLAPATGDYGIFSLGDNTPLSSGRVAAGGSTNRLEVGCVQGSDGTKLSLQVGDGSPIEVTDPNGQDTFKAIGLGLYSPDGGAEVAFDNLRVVKED